MANTKALNKDRCLALLKYSTASDAVKVAFKEELPLTLTDEEYHNRVKSLTCTLHRYFDKNKVAWPWKRTGRPPKWG